MRDRPRFRCLPAVTALAIALVLSPRPCRAEDAKHAAVISQQAGTVSIVAVDELRALRTIAVPGVPAGGAASPDGRSLWISHPDLGKISRIDLTTDMVMTFEIGGEPFGLVVTADGGSVLSTDWAANALIRIDTTSGRETARTEVGRSPAHIALDARRALAYVADRESNSVSVVDIVSMTRVGTIEVGTGPFALALSPDGMRLYVGNVRSNDVSVIDTMARREIKRLKTGLMPYGVSVSADGARIAVTNQQSGTLSIIDGVSLEVQAPARIGAAPEGVTFISPVCVLVVDWSKDEIISLDPARITNVRRLKVGAGPRAVIAIPRDADPQ
ncbi:YncE family protein [Terrihabitans sp. B22-R8]|uniref:YncE family protein n=1 Tax=Terrihabitans sp. B22-R8 TaxID=3425128 RepID=UPI00403C5E87